MMKFDTISNTAHSLEDMFYFLREQIPPNLDSSRLTDNVLAGMDFIKEELAKIEEGEVPDGDSSEIVAEVREYLAVLKGSPETKPEAKSDAKPEKSEAKPVQTNKTEAKTETKAETKSEAQPKANDETVVTEKASGKSSGGIMHSYNATIHFEAGCEMENVRAYTIVHNLGQIASNVTHEPADVINEDAIDVIRTQGFSLSFTSALPYNDIMEHLSQTIYLYDLKLVEKQVDTSVMNKYTAIVHFDEGAEMENVRAFAMLKNISEHMRVDTYRPMDLENPDNADVIRESGFTINFLSMLSYEDVKDELMKTIYLKDLDLMQVDNDTKTEVPAATAQPVQQAAVTQEAAPPEETGVEAKHPAPANAESAKRSAGQHMISISLNKLDDLLNLMGELVISESMVTQNPDLNGLELDSFLKEARQLRKIIGDIQETVLSMRMVSLSPTFLKMQRIVRDMCRQLSKDVDLVVVGSETEVDKNVIEHIADPLMHIIRNSIDHGIENPDIRKQKGKPERGVVQLEAKTAGGDVLIHIKDDGQGLNRNKILAKAKANGLLRKAETDYTDKEIYQFIFMPGFSTAEQVTNFSGRGVGMDVVVKNLETISGSVLIDSTPGEGSTFTLKIPLSLAIIAGMIIRIGEQSYTLPIISIKRSFQSTNDMLFRDPDGNEMITERGEVYNVVRLNDYFGLNEGEIDAEKGIFIMIENDDQHVCLFADELVSEQPVVVKAIPKYIKKVKGINGCTLLGNGDISIIIDVASFFDK
jgi:two-component system chemotaxis sensor kinase CheA